MKNASIAALDLVKDGSSPGPRSPVAGRSAERTRVTRIEHLTGTAGGRFTEAQRAVSRMATGFWARSRSESHFVSLSGRIPDAHVLLILLTRKLSHR